MVRTPFHRTNYCNMLKSMSKCYQRFHNSNFHTTTREGPSTPYPLFDATLCHLCLKYVWFRQLHCYIPENCPIDHKKRVQKRSGLIQGSAIALFPNADTQQTLLQINLFRVWKLPTVAQLNLCSNALCGGNVLVHVFR